VHAGRQQRHAARGGRDHRRGRNQDVQVLIDPSRVLDLDLAMWMEKYLLAIDAAASLSVSAGRPVLAPGVTAATDRIFLARRVFQSHLFVCARSNRSCEDRSRAAVLN
jgi:hypothetical protein